MKLAKAQSASEDDFFRCVQYLFDYDQWLTDTVRGSRLNSLGLLRLKAAEELQLQKIRYFEALGCHFEGPSLYDYQQRMVDLVASGEWTPFLGSEFSGFPALQST